MTYTIVFIDEVKDNRDDFDGIFKDQHAVSLEPKPDIAQMLSEIMLHHPKAVITDYRLKDHMPTVTYDGLDLINEVQRVFPHMPVFMLTDYDNQAVMEEKCDANCIYPKEYLSNQEPFKISFREKVLNKIKFHDSKITDAKTELSHLLKLRGTSSLNAEQENRIIELDKYISESLGSTIPDQLKEYTHIKNTLDLIKKTEELIDLVKSKPKSSP